MVAVKGKGWQLNPLLVRAEQEANAKAPGRKKTSDGSIGDAAHQSRDSFHNPWEGWVDALDLTHDPAGGLDVHALFREWVATNDLILGALDHLISNGQIASAARGWIWREYTGANDHVKHGHMAGKRNNAARAYAGPIFIRGDDMDAAQDERLKKVERDVTSIRAETDKLWSGETVTRIAEAVVKLLPKANGGGGLTAAEVVDELERRLAD